MKVHWTAATLVYNTPDLAARMREQLPGVLIIDNGSHPPIPGASISLPLNRGFVGGWNEAMRRIMKDWPDDDGFVWMLNSDVEGVSPAMGDALAAYAEQRDLDAVTPPFNSPHAAFMNGPRFVNWIDWCCPMVRLSTWLGVGEFDPASSGYFADIDWCKRASNNGAQFAVVPVAPVHHLGSVTANRIGHTWNADDSWLCQKWHVKSWMDLT